MSLIKTMRKQTAIWWEAQALDHYGRPTYAAPIEIKCRWKDGSEEIRGPQGEHMKFHHTVYVDRLMKEGDMLKLGEIDSFTPEDPTQDPAAVKILKFDQCPNFKATETLLTAFL